MENFDRPTIVDAARSWLGESDPDAGVVGLVREAIGDYLASRYIRWSNEMLEVWKAVSSQHPAMVDLGWVGLAPVEG